MLQRLKEERLRALLEKNEERLKELEAERMERSIIVTAGKHVEQEDCEDLQIADKEDGFLKLR